MRLPRFNNWSLRYKLLVVLLQLGITTFAVTGGIAYIRHLQASTPVWNAAVYNCVAFIQDIARYAGLRVPNNHWMYPEDWVNRLRALNSGGGREQKTARAPKPAAQPTEAAAH